MPDPLTLPEVRHLLARAEAECSDGRRYHPSLTDWPAACATVCRLVIGLAKAHDLLNKGLESATEQLDALKQQTRAQAEEIERLKVALRKREETSC